MHVMKRKAQYVQPTANEATIVAAIAKAKTFLNFILFPPFILYSKTPLLHLPLYRLYKRKKPYEFQLKHR